MIVQSISEFTQINNEIHSLEVFKKKGNFFCALGMSGAIAIFELESCVEVFRTDEDELSSWDVSLLRNLGKMGCLISEDYHCLYLLHYRDGFIIEKNITESAKELKVKIVEVFHDDTVMFKNEHTPDMIVFFDVRHRKILKTMLIGNAKEREIGDINIRSISCDSELNDNILVILYECYIRQEDDQMSEVCYDIICLVITVEEEVLGKFSMLEKFQGRVRTITFDYGSPGRIVCTNGDCCIFIYNWLDDSSLDFEYKALLDESGEKLGLDQILYFYNGKPQIGILEYSMSRSSDFTFFNENTREFESFEDHLEVHYNCSKNRDLRVNERHLNKRYSTHFSRIVCGGEDIFLLKMPDPTTPGKVQSRRFAGESPSMMIPPNECIIFHIQNTMLKYGRTILDKDEKERIQFTTDQLVEYDYGNDVSLLKVSFLDLGKTFVFLKILFC